MSNPIEPVPGPHGYEVTLPCSPEDFRDFIGGLLGKPQVAEQRIAGSFEVDLASLTNLHHLVDQRIHQQNDAHLVQFLAKIVYDDDSSVQLNSFEDFARFQEVHPKISVGVSLTWIYLITFQRKNVPEKQQIDITFSSTEGLFVDGSLASFSRGPDIRIAVSYTERTWGQDMQSLLVGHIGGLVKAVSPLRQWAATRSDLLGLGSGVAFVLASAVGVMIASDALINSQVAIATKLFGAPASTLAQLAERIEYLVSVTGQGLWPRFAFAAVVLLLVALVLSVVFGVLVTSIAEIRPRAFILLTDAARANRTRQQDADRRVWFARVGSIVASLAGGIVSNILYGKYFASL